MKRLIKVLMTIMLVVSLIPRNIAFAYSEEELIARELEVAIISGDGSAGNPYEVDYSKAPHFKEYMDTLNEEVMSVLQGDISNNMNARGIYDGILTGGTRSNQTNGGEWKYTSGAPSVNYNGNICMKKIVYISRAKTAKIADVLNNGDFDEVENLKNTIVNSSYSAARTALAAKIGTEAAEAVLVAVGKFSAIFTVAEALKFINDYFVKSRYATAKTNGYGMINATYQTSYNGSWYAQYGEDTWTDPHTVHLPGSYYGTGSYTSY